MERKVKPAIPLEFHLGNTVKLNGQNGMRRLWRGRV
jgi:hypothetical protein